MKASQQIKVKLIKDIESRRATIGVIGLGYVGLPLVVAFANEGFKVIGFDNDPKKTKKLNSGKTYIEHIPDAVIQKVKQQKFVATTDFSKIKQVDCILICLPTPLNKHREPDLSYVVNSIVDISPYLRKGQLISLESTTYPGTTEEEILPRMKAVKLSVGKEAFLVFSPERVDPGNKDFEIRDIPKVCGGHTKNCLDVGVALYSKIIDKVVPVSSTKAAEMTKLLENIQRSVNIGLMNELKIVADKMGLNIYEVIKASSTKPFGFMPYYPGPGLGGHCIPIDPFYLTWKAREYGINTKFIELAGEINSSMPDWVVQKTILALNDRGCSIKNSNVLIVGIAYKKNVDDIRESPAAEIIEKLLHHGAKIKYSDPHIPVMPKMRSHQKLKPMSSVRLDSKTLKSSDCVIVVTNHDKFDYKLIKKYSKLIVDTRGVYPSGKNVVSA